MLTLYLDKRTHRGVKPAAELSLADDETRFTASTDDISLITMLKGLASRPLCSISRSKAGTVKCPAEHKFKELLRYIKRPYFFGDRNERPWKYVEVIAL